MLSGSLPKFTFGRIAGIPLRLDATFVLVPVFFLAGLSAGAIAERRVEVEVAGDTGLHLVLISVHGLIRGRDLELGRDADTGGQTKYVVELARALAELPRIERVDLVTRLVVDESVGPDYAELIQHDAYYRDQSHLPPAARAKVNYDHPESLETELLVEHLTELLAGRSVEKPEYDFTVHTRKPETTTLHPMPVVVVEGILVLVERELRRRLREQNAR